ncbi:MAG: hypothetical protein WA001_01315 [Patescibacteria group bacterium]
MGIREMFFGRPKAQGASATKPAAVVPTPPMLIDLNSLVRFDVERLASTLEAQTGQSLIIGSKEVSAFDGHAGPMRPLHFPRERDLRFFYLSKPGADHERGPMLGDESCHEVTWVLSMVPYGLWMQIELFDVSLEEALLLALQAVANTHTYVVTIHDIYPTPDHRPGRVRGSIQWMKHRVCPLPTDSRSIYRAR